MKSLPQHLSPSLKADAETSQSYEVREVTVLMAEIQNFATIFDTLSSEVMIDMVNRYVSVMSTLIVSQFNGTVNNILNNTLMASFETPLAETNKLLAALTCAIEMQRAMDDINQTHCALRLPFLYMGIGLDVGQVIAGSFGSTLYSEYTFIGNTISLANHCKNNSLRGQIFISDAVYQQAKQGIETGAAIPALMKEAKKNTYFYPLYAVKKPHYVALPKIKTRQSPRVLVNVPIRYQCIDDESHAGEFFKGEIIDISYGGMYASVSCLPLLYSEITFCLPLPLWNGKYRDVYAKVLTVCKEENTFYVGTVFTRMDEETRFSIKQVVDIIRESIALQYLDVLPFHPL